MRAQSWSEKTIRERISLVRRVAAGAGRDPADLTHDDVLAFLAGTSFGPASRRAYFMWLRSWFVWLVRDGYRADDPTMLIDKPRAPRRDRAPLTAAHVRHLLSMRLRPRTRTMILLAAYQGLRASEVAAVAGTDIDAIGQTFTVLGKGGVLATLPLHPVIQLEAEHYPQGLWFPSPHDSSRPIYGESVTDVVGEAMKRAGIPGTCHSLRHWYATEMLRQGADLRRIQQLMRHATLATTERYLHVDDSARRAALMLLPDVTSAA